MNHTHLSMENWGVCPALFEVGGRQIPTYSVMVLLALLVGGLLYYREARKEPHTHDKAFLIPIVALIGGILGAKIPTWLENFGTLSFSGIFAGRTIVGGLIGGTISVMLLKRYLGIKERRGNLFAPAVAAGLAIGRIGCFMGGCCYGIPSTLPWAVDFGDGIPRHPTQLYEAAFALAIFAYLQYTKNTKHSLPPGLLFDHFLNGYFLFRFTVEFIRVHPTTALGLTMYQLFSLAALLYINREILFKRGIRMHLKKTKERATRKKFGGKQ
ncbi:MAG: prolipoprotein diacylglyceryl transferase [bacterium]|nr:prolipoprotein diacylglyceryl transferase [bacterium]